MHNCFHAADILIPRHISMTKWACVACDQFSSQRSYWEEVEEFVGNAPSTLHMIVPEAYLKQGRTAGRLRSIHGVMERYLAAGLFQTYRRSFIYLERTMADGSLRHGLIGQVDLEDYAFAPDSGALIRATEGTVRDRIPLRVKLLEDAPLELPHVLLLCDDRRDRVMEAARSVLGEKVYDFDLMQQGGHITGHLISGLGVSVVNAAVSAYLADTDGMAFAVGDGNHSLAAAKTCWEAIKPTLNEAQRLEHPARYALVELENIHDPAIRFAPIHRLLTGGEPALLLERLRAMSVPEGHRVTVVTGKGEETLYLSRTEGPLAVAVLQPVLDRYVRDSGAEIDYIHGEETVRALARQDGAVGILLPAMEKDALFPAILRGGALPRKTFSMGSAREKRYYLEGKMRR